MIRRPAGWRLGKQNRYRSPCALCVHLLTEALDRTGQALSISRKFSRDPITIEIKGFLKDFAIGNRRIAVRLEDESKNGYAGSDISTSIASKTYGSIFQPLQVETMRKSH